MLAAKMLTSSFLVATTLAQDCVALRALLVGRPEIYRRDVPGHQVHQLPPTASGRIMLRTHDGRVPVGDIIVDECVEKQSRAQLSEARLRLGEAILEIISVQRVEEKWPCLSWMVDCATCGSRDRQLKEDFKNVKEAVDAIQQLQAANGKQAVPVDEMAAYKKMRSKECMDRNSDMDDRVLKMNEAAREWAQSCKDPNRSVKETIKKINKKLDSLKYVTIRPSWQTDQTLW